MIASFYVDRIHVEDGSSFLLNYVITNGHIRDYREGEASKQALKRLLALIIGGWFWSFVMVYWDSNKKPGLWVQRLPQSPG